MKTLTALPIFFFFLFLSLSIVNAQEYNISDCSELNVTEATYYLTQDIINSNVPTCMNITANNVALDCQGHTIDGVDASDTYGIYISRSASTTTNVT
ncbi:MAG: hypothetical protein ACPLYF_02365, partial [Fervidobacterium sp.]